MNQPVSSYSKETTASPPMERASDTSVPLLLVLAMLGAALLFGVGLYVVSSRQQTAQHAAMTAAEEEAFRAAQRAEMAGPDESSTPRAPSFLGDFPDFALTDQEGRPYGSVDLKGRVWVLQFFFACCDKSCPTMVRQMAELQPKVPDPQLRFVSISVDPDRDTPAGVASHAARFAELTGLADRSRWSLLTGSRPQIVKLLEDCRLPLSPTALLDKGDLGHVDRFFLIDEAGRLRGMYDYSDAARMKALENDIRTLATAREAGSGSAAGSATDAVPTPGTGS